MSTTDTASSIRVAGLTVQIHRKAIKNLHLSVLPPDGKVRISVPQHVTEDAVRLAVVDKLGWIKRQRKEFREQARQTERRYVSGESHYYLGKAYRLTVEEGKRQSVAIGGGKRLILITRPDGDKATRERALSRWYRQQVAAQIPPLLDKWHPRVGKECSRWGIKQMKTKWGSCNADTGSIWVNLELAKKPFACLEYIVVHELVHLHERTHNQRFRGWMDKLLPDWPDRRRLLNSSPLAHEDWRY